MYKAGVGTCVSVPAFLLSGNPDGEIKDCDYLCIDMRSVPKWMERCNLLTIRT